MKNQKIKKNFRWFAFQPTREIILPIILGILAIVFSMLMNSTDFTLLRMFYRSICQMSIIGVLIPLVVMYHKGELRQAGIKWEKPIKMFGISIILGALLSIVFIKEGNGHINNLLGPVYLESTLYVMIANIFEVTFFFAYIRYYLEKSFGIIPAIVLTALFYSLHHAGFEPAFIELFIVGVVFIGIFRIANNVLICFPLWWVGGLGDVLVSKSDTIDHTRMTFLGILPVLISFFLAFGIILILSKKRHLSANR